MPHRSTRAIRPNRSPRDITLAPPGSKSLSNRALICAAFSGKPCHISGISPSDDTRHLIEALRVVGYDMRQDNNSASIGGCINLPDEILRVHAGKGGTTARFLLPLLASIDGRFILDADEQLRRRPIAPLVDALRELGANITYMETDGHLPVQIVGKRLMGSCVHLSMGMSSQFVSALLMLGATLSQELTITLDGETVSEPYVDMTIAVLKAFGAPEPRFENNSVITRPTSSLGAATYHVEPDASGATYLWAAAALTKSRCVIPGLSLKSRQGDCRFVRLLEQMGCCVIDGAKGLGIDARGLEDLRSISCNMADMPDAAPTLAVLAPFAKGATRITGLGTLRHKECDRIAALHAEMSKLGAVVRSGPDWIEIDGGHTLRGTTLATHDDHRIAMALALIGLRVSSVIIENPDCVAKSYPGYWEHLAKFEES